MRREMVDTEDLIAAIREGQPWASHALVTTVTPVLLGYASLVGGGVSQTDQEFTVEAAIMRGVERIDRYDPRRGSFAGWLRPFVRHALGDIRRRGATTEPLLTDVLEPDSSSSQSTDPEANKAVARAMQKLRSTDELILRLRESEGLSYEQCAERIGGVTAGACRVRHHRALRRLSEYLSSEPSLARYFEEVTR